MSEPAAQHFNDRLAETQSGATEVQEFALKTSYAFPSADVLVPAPMAVSILGQLILVATATDFRLVRPTDGFKHVRYPDSFRATIIQLVNTGALALNESFLNFDEINKRCAAVPRGVNNIVQLLVGDERNTPREDKIALERHLPNQIESLSRTVEACLQKAKATDKAFGQLLQLTMEIHEACAATQGENEGQVKEAELRKQFLAEEQKAAEEMKRLSREKAKEAREDFVKAQSQFNKAADDMPGGAMDDRYNWADRYTDDGTVRQDNSRHYQLIRNPSSSHNGGVQPEPPVDMADIRDPGYQKASMLRNLAEILHTLLTSGENGRPDWNSIVSFGKGGCKGVRVGFEQVIQRINPKHPYAGHASTEAVSFAQRGIEYASRLGSILPPGSEDDLRGLVADISSWREDVIAFASEADLKLGTSQTDANAFLPVNNLAGYSGGGAELAVRNAQYHLAMRQAQLNKSRESSNAASEKLMEITGQLGDILAQVGKIEAQKRNWEEITAILLRAIDFLCELKRYLNNLVHFFDSVHSLVSVTLREAANQFIQIVKDGTAIEDSCHAGNNANPRNIGGITLDAWARQAIYNHALSTAKVSKVVENISSMYVTLYNGNVHPGVNMLLGMGKHVGSNDQAAIAAAGKEIQDWAKDASDRIVQLLSEHMHANERDIQIRMKELERSLGGILPQSEKINNIVQNAVDQQVKEVSQEINAAMDENFVFRKLAKARVFV